MKTLSWGEKKEIPIISETEVLVVGGGPGGLGAAVTAARNGAETMLVERYGSLGGTAVFAEVLPFMPNHWQKDDETWFRMDRPIFVEFQKKMEQYLPEKYTELTTADPERRTQLARNLSIPAVSLAMEDLCLESGVKLLFNHELVDCVVDKGKIIAAIFHSKSGFSAIVARTFIDATGDGDLAVLAGAPYEFGNESGFCQPMTLCFKLNGVDKNRVNRDEWQQLYEAAKASGEIDCPRENVLAFPFFDDDVVHFNTTRVIKRSGVSGIDLSEAEIEGRRQIRQIVAWLRKRVAGFEHAVLRSMGIQIGVRESRRILGRAYLTHDVFEKRQKFPDGIMRCNYPIDIHNPEGTGTTLIHIPFNDYFEVPFGCLLPRGLNNLAIAGRSISVDHELHSSTRCMPQTCTVGQAAGMAAAMAKRQNCDIAEIDGVELRKELVAFGAFL